MLWGLQNIQLTHDHLQISTKWEQGLRARFESNIWVERKYSEIRIRLSPFSISPCRLVYLSNSIWHTNYWSVYCGSLVITSLTKRYIERVVLCRVLFLYYLLFHCNKHGYWYRPVDDDEIRLLFAPGSLLQSWLANYHP